MNAVANAKADLSNVAGIPNNGDVINIYCVY